jgi:hypothetical protein
LLDTRFVRQDQASYFYQVKHKKAALEAAFLYKMLIA